MFLDICFERYKNLQINLVFKIYFVCYITSKGITFNDKVHTAPYV